jgi:hypothetical protein
MGAIRQGCEGGWGRNVVVIADVLRAWSFALYAVVVVVVILLLLWT